MAEDIDTEIDPRIADRRDEVQREHRHRLMRRLGLLGGVLVLLGAAVVATRSPLLDVDHVDIRGVGPEQQQEAMAVAGSLEGKPLFDVDSASVGDQLAALPWVAAAQVRREWPGTVVIDLTEREEVAVVADGDGRWQVLDASGKVVRAVDEPDPAWLELVGVEPAPATGEQVVGATDLLEVVQAVTPAVADRVSGVRVGQSGDLLLEIDPVGVVRLGDLADLDQKMQATATLFAEVDDRCVAMIDVRVPSVPTIERIPACANPTPSTTAAPAVAPTAGPTATEAPVSTDPAEQGGEAPTSIGG